jgi:hypothetical protein
MFTSFDKALVPAVVMIVLGGLAAVGVTEDMTVGEAVSYAVTACFVWLIPNKVQ